MRLMKYFAAAAILLSAFTFAAIPQADAAPAPTTPQQSTTLTITQDQINASYGITNPALRGYSDVSVTLNSDDTMTINSTLTGWHGKSQRFVSVFGVTSTFPVSLRTTTPFFDIKSLTINGQPATPQQLAMERYRHRYGIHHFVVSQIESQLKTMNAYLTHVTITSVTISEGQILVGVEYYPRA